MTETPTPTPRFLKDREQSVTLHHPFQLGDYTYSAVHVRRLTVADVRAFADSTDDDAELPMFFRPDGAPMPTAAMDALDADDDERVQEIALRFLPRRLRPETPSVLRLGAATSQSAPASSEADPASTSP